MSRAGNHAAVVPGPRSPCSGGTQPGPGTARRDDPGGGGPVRSPLPYGFNDWDPATITPTGLPRPLALGRFGVILTPADLAGRAACIFVRAGTRTPRERHPHDWSRLGFPARQPLGCPAPISAALGSLGARLNHRPYGASWSLRRGPLDRVTPCRLALGPARPGRLPRTRNRRCGVQQVDRRPRLCERTPSSRDSLDQLHRSRKGGDDRRHELSTPPPPGEPDPIASIPRQTRKRRWRRPTRYRFLMLMANRYLQFIASSLPAGRQRPPHSPGRSLRMRVKSAFTRRRSLWAKSPGGGERAHDQELNIRSARRSAAGRSGRAAACPAAQHDLQRPGPGGYFWRDAPAWVSAIQDSAKANQCTTAGPPESRANSTSPRDAVAARVLPRISWPCSPQPISS